MTYLVIAYAGFWLIIFFYIFLLRNNLRKVEKEIELLKTLYEAQEKKK